MRRCAAVVAAGVLLAVCGASGIARADVRSSCSNPSVGLTVPVPDFGEFGPSVSTWLPGAGPSACELSATHVTGASLGIGGSPVVQFEADGPHFVLDLKVQVLRKADLSVLGEA